MFFAGGYVHLYFAKTTGNVNDTHLLTRISLKFCNFWCEIFEDILNVCCYVLRTVSFRVFNYKFSVLCLCKRIFFKVRLVSLRDNYSSSSTKPFIVFLESFL